MKILIIIILSLCIVSSTFKLHNGIEIIGRAEKNVDDGVTILLLSGDSYEMGFQYGTLMKEELMDSASIFRKIIQDNEKNIFKIIIKNIKAGRLINREYKKLPIRYQDEIIGMYDGSGLRFRDIKMLTCAHAFINFGCSSFLINTGEQILHARNFDYAPIEISEYPILVHYQPDDRLSYVNIGSCGYLGMHTGMNEYGISFSNNNSEGFDDQTETMSYLYASRQILETAKSLKDVELYCADFNSDHGAIWTFNSRRDNDALIIDLFPGKSVMSYLEARTDVAVWNFFHNKKMKEDFNTLFSIENDYRPKAYSKIIAQHIPETIDDMFQLLSDTSYYDYPFVPGAGSINNASTLMSVVFDNKEDKIYYSFSDGYSGGGRFYLYDAVRKHSVPYHEAPIDSGHENAKQQMVFRNDQYLKQLSSGNFRNLYSKTNTDYPIPYNMLRTLMLFLDYPGVEPDTESLEKTIETMLSEYPTLSELYLLKAEIEALKENYEDAVFILLDYIESGWELPAGKLFSLHYFLAKYADKAYDMSTRKKSAEIVITIYEKYRRAYDPNNDYFIKEYEQYKNWAEEPIVGPDSWMKLNSTIR